MPYLGNTAASRFVSNRAASVYSGDGSTVAFTLEQVVAQDEDVLVSVDGVIQEPSVAYAVSSGTTLTFTAAPSTNSGNNIFVYYLASQAGTVGHPSTQALSATNGTFSGTLAVTGVLTGTSLDISGNIDIDGTTNLDVVDIDGAVNMAAVLTANGGVVFNEGSADVDFRVETNGDANMFIVDGGNDQVMIGTNTVVANSTLHIAGPLKTANAGATVPNNNFNVFSEAGNNTYNTIFENQASTTNSQYMISMRFTAASTDNNAALFLDCRDATTQRLSISSDGDVKNHDNSYGAISDLKLKEQITDASEQWDDVKALKIRKYKFKTDVATGDSDSHWRLGVIAQEVETAGMSGLVKNEADLQEIDGINSETGTTTKSVKYSILYMKAVKALQEAMTRIETLESKVTALENA